ncbi:sialic acid-binding Ig-like lectin 12 [Trachemys scripta elegans]|uniref:sialic acid-binding Ig-like lectin 12 n=1 Tax=Trachemys scripta elegans TaxID=31138 RepID=UPI001553F65E|nr:sialic acid-binding Ig-like lectin 12 [Trachemys scripta elegans]
MKFEDPCENRADQLSPSPEQGPTSQRRRNLTNWKLPVVEDPLSNQPPSTAAGLSQPDAPAMGRALLPQYDTGERELPPQGPLWREGSPATLRVLILALLWRGSLSQPPGFTLAVLQSVSVQEGLCVLVPCNFTYPASYDTDNPSDQLYGQWYKEPATVGQDPPVASSLFTARVSQETQGRFWLMGDPAHGDCSLQISDARRTDEGRYFLYIEKGMFEHIYRSNSDGTALALTISVTGLTEEPEIQISPAQRMPGMLLAGKPVTMTCTAPGRCSGSPPQVTWTGPFSDTARNVSAPLANGTWAHRSTLSFTPTPGDHGKELVCTVTYSPPRGPSTSRTIRLHVIYPTGPPTITGNLMSHGCPGGLPRAFIEISCKLIFMATGFFLAYYFTLLY